MLKVIKRLQHTKKEGYRIPQTQAHYQTNIHQIWEHQIVYRSQKLLEKFSTFLIHPVYAFETQVFVPCHITIWKERLHEKQKPLFVHLPHTLRVVVEER